MKPFSLTDFVIESNRIEGIERTTTKQVTATAKFLTLPRLTIDALLELVSVYQPGAQPRFTRGLNVQIGNYFPSVGGPLVKARLQSLLENIIPCRDAYEMHVEYEHLHPFTDGNGRSGRVVWLWRMGGIDAAPLGFLHHFYYQALKHSNKR